MEGNKGINAIQSLRNSVLRIVEQGFDEVSGDAVIVATVKETFSDVMELDTFGTMSCFDNKSKIDIFDVPLNAHLTDDGTTSISGSYTFPKIGSDVYLLRDVDDNHERYICILFSQVETVFETYNTSKTTKLVEVDTSDATKPYETTETGNSLESTQTPTSFFEKVAYDDGGGSVEYALLERDIKKNRVTVTDGTATAQVVTRKDMHFVDVGDVLVTTNETTHTIDTGETLEPAVLGNQLVAQLLSLIDEIGNITIQTPSGVSSPIMSSPDWTVLKNKFTADFEEFNSTGVIIS
jgi:hypothetical protein